MQLCSSLSILWHCLSLGLEWNLIFSSPVATAEFSKFAFTASSLRIWNSSTGIPSPPLALFAVMLSKAHLTSHYRMSGSRWVWVITPSWLSQSWRSFLYSSSVYSCHFFLVSSALSISFLSFIFCMKCSLGISNFLEEISSLSHFIVFLYLFALIIEKGFLISPCYSLKLCIQMGISFLSSVAFGLYPANKCCTFLYQSLESVGWLYEQTQVGFGNSFCTHVGPHHLTWVCLMWHLRP